jgi:hypothetical protein
MQVAENGMSPGQCERREYGGNTSEGDAESGSLEQSDVKKMILYKLFYFLVCDANGLGCFPFYSNERNALGHVITSISHEFSDRVRTAE